jgi:hypothetical protein
VAPFNRVFDGCAQRGQHDCDRSHIRVGAAVLIRSQAMVVTRGAPLIMNYLPLISATVIMLVILAFAAEASSQ